MKNPLLLHDLLYIGEHQTCNHYRADVGSGFIYEELEAGETERLDTVRRNHLLILLEGRCSLDCNQFSGRDFSAGEMILVPRSAAFSGRTLTRVRLLDMAFEKPESGCDRLVLQSYHTLCRQLRYDFRPTEIRYPLTAFFDLLVFCLKNGMSCAHLHEMKHRELFFYLRGFYSKEEIAGLFYPIVSRSFDFRNFVFENYRKVHSLKELIDLSPMSRSTFLRRRLDAETDMPAHRRRDRLSGDDDQGPHGQVRLRLAQQLQPLLQSEFPLYAVGADTQIPQGRVMQIATQYLTGIHTDTSCVSRIARPSETPARHPTSGL